MRNLTISETNHAAGGNTVITAGAMLFGTTALVLFLGCYTKRNCGWQAVIVDNTYFQYQWTCE